MSSRKNTTNFEKSELQRKQAIRKFRIATANGKQYNYIEGVERLELLVEQFLSFAELRTIEKKPMYMTDWVKKLDEFLILNEKEILAHTGKISHKEMETKVREELGKYNEQRQRKQIEAPK
jgi:hypothetical protein